MSSQQKVHKRKCEQKNSESRQVIPFQDLTTLPVGIENQALWYTQTRLELYPCDAMDHCMDRRMNAVIA